MYDDKNVNVNPETSETKRPRWFDFGLQISKRLIIIGLYTFDVSFDMLNGVDFLTGQEYEHGPITNEITMDRLAIDKTGTDHSRYCTNWGDYKHTVWGSLTIGNLVIYLKLFLIKIKINIYFSFYHIN